MDNTHTTQVRVNSKLKTIDFVRTSRAQIQFLTLQLCGPRTCVDHWVGNISELMSG